VIDDGGTDNTKDIVAGLNDKRFQYYWKENAERGAARNFGASIAQGKYLNFFDSDDLVYCDHIDIASKVVSDNTGIKAFHLGYDMRNLAGEVIYSETNSDKIISNLRLLQNNFLNPNSIFIERKFFERVKFSENRNLSGSEDWLQLLDVISITDFYCFDSKASSCMIQHSDRSMKLATGLSTELRTKELLNEVKRRPLLIAKYPNVKVLIKSEMYSLSALHYALEGNQKDVLRCLTISIRSKYRVVFSRRFLAIIKHILFSKGK
jgi:glycosyltransferase involved in cell wall biosynthesis